MTICKQCNQERPDYFFLPGLRDCKTCRNEKRKLRKRAGRVLCCNKLSLPGKCPRCAKRAAKRDRVLDRQDAILNRTKRKCPTCQVTKHLDKFRIDASNVDGHQYICAECMKIKAREDRTPKVGNFNIYTVKGRYILALSPADLQRILPVPPPLHKFTIYMKPCNTLLTLTGDTFQGACAQVDKFLRYFQC
jgi:hypothetical protein